MKPPDPSEEDARRTKEEIRARAEAIARRRADSEPTSTPAPSPHSLQESLQELRVHQIELELQNEELLHTERTLRVARARYADLYDHAPVGYLSLGPSGEVVEVNRTLLGMLGLSTEALLGRPLTALIVARDQDVWYLAERDLERTGAPQACELRLRRGDGEALWVRMDVMLRRVEGEQPVTRIAVSDIDARRRAAAAAERAARRYQTIFQSASDALMTTAPPTWRVLAGNEAALRMFGAANEAQLADVELWDHARVGDPGHGAPSVPGSPAFHLGFAEGVRRSHATLRRLSGEEFPASISVTSVEFDDERALLLTVRDETESTALRAALSQAERVASMGLLAASVAHEINNPLTYMLIAIESIEKELRNLGTSAPTRPDRGRAERDDPASDDASSDTRPRFTIAERARLEELSARAHTVLDAARRIRSIAIALGSFSRVGDVAPTNVDVRLALENALEMASNEIRHRARVVRELAEVPAVHAREGQLTQVFLNLLMNAAYAIDPGAASENEITIRTWAEAEDVLVEVGDTGVGIPAEALERVFDAFYSTRPNLPGTGLGLGISRDIVRALGGAIQIESEVGVGTRVRVRLPASTHPTESRDLPASTASTHTRGRLLVVDDEPMIHTITSRLLGAEHSVVVAGSGREAKAILEEDRDFDLVLSDLMMPEMSGMELHRWLATVDGDLARRTVFMTGGMFAPQVREYVSRQPNEVLEKPFESSTLTRLVNRLVAQARAGQSRRE